MERLLTPSSAVLGCLFYCLLDIYGKRKMATLDGLDSLDCLHIVSIQLLLAYYL